MSVTLLEGSSVFKPRLQLQWADSMTQYNYLYIPAFDRYYFINDISADIGGLAIISAECDVLMTYGDAIKLCPAVVTRTTRLNQRGSLRSTWIKDTKFPLTTGRTIKAIEFEGTVLNIDSAGMTDNNFVLNVAGGGAITS